MLQVHTDSGSDGGDTGNSGGESALTIRTDRLAVDSRYAKIMEVMRGSAQQRPRL